MEQKCCYLRKMSCVLSDISFFTAKFKKKKVKHPKCANSIIFTGVM